MKYFLGHFIHSNTRNMNGSEVSSQNIGTYILYSEKYTQDNPYEFMPWGLPSAW